MQRRQVLKQMAALGGLAVVGRSILAEGTQTPFLVLPTAQASEAKGKVEVIEFFHYGCPHCRDFDPLLEQWAKALPADVVFRRVPAIWGNPQLGQLARFYYAAEATGDLAKLHGKVFDALQADKVPLNTEAGALEWVGRQGVDGKKFADAYKSFGVQSRVQRADQLARAYQIQGVPTLAIGGKYLTSASLAGSHPNTLKVADELIARSRKELGRG
jgi:protein dithiol oxidoreductase (disulfide-forming)